MHGKEVHQAHDPLPFRLACFYFAHFAYGGAFVAYLPLYLAWRGLQPGEIAWVLALPQLARTFAPAAWGWVADRSGAQRGIVAFSCAAIAAGFGMLPYTQGVVSISWVIGVLSLLSAGALPLVEAVTLALVGGMLGVGIGLDATPVVPLILGGRASYPAPPSLSAIAAALGLTVGIGLVFGTYPALRASRLVFTKAFTTSNCFISRSK